MTRFLDDQAFAVLEAACERLIPRAAGHPGGRAVGAADYIDAMLGAFTVEPPRIWAGGPFSGRFGGEPSFDTFIALTPVEELAWRTRIEGSQGMPTREFNGPVVGWQQQYAEGLAALGAEFCELSAAEQAARLDAHPAFKQLMYLHACEGAYGAPEYGGNRAMQAWKAIQFPGDVQPRGYTDDEVSQP